MIPISLVPNAGVDARVKYQLITLILAGLVLAATYALSPASFRVYFRRGQIDAPVEPVKLIGIGPNETWRSLGRNFAIVISIVTFAVIYVGFMQGRSLAPETVPYLPWIVVLALSNSFVEEMITRLGVISALDQLVPRQSIYLISAAIFGLVHYFGTPGGIPGVLLAGFLGWLLAKSIVETRGIFWAWFIHFLQDVIIFIGFFFVMS
jgi:membrane protease YdiL (CAAX protease family)